VTGLPRVLITAGPWSGVTGQLLCGQAGQWVVYLPATGRYVTVEDVEIVTGDAHVDDRS